jgi:hypothetical protein
MVKPSLAQTPTASPVSIPTPSVPEFTLKLVGPPYVQNTTYSLDTNTGQIVAKIGYTNPYSALEINVRNQPFVKPYEGAFGNLYYNVRIKDHDATGNWIEVYNANYFFPIQEDDSDYTNVGGSIEDFNFAGSLVGRQVDIQVEAMLGGIFRSSPAFGSGDEFRGAVSGWSSTQTISIPANTPLSPTPTSTSSSTPPNSTSTPTPTSTPSIGIVAQYQSVVVILVILLLAVTTGFLIYFKKRKTNAIA